MARLYTCAPVLYHSSVRARLSDAWCSRLAFLATLLLLIIVSAGVVVRAYLVRRVLQRRLHEALAPAGYEHPDPGGPSARARRKKIKYGEKPRLWEASVTLDGFAEASHASTWMVSVSVSVKLVANGVYPQARLRPTATWSNGNS